MNEDITQMLEGLIPWAVGTIVVMVALAIGVYITLPKLIVRWHLRKASGAEREQFERKVELLEHEAIVEFYAPSRSFQKECDPEKATPKQQAWLSPYRSAVKAANKRHKRDKRGTMTLTREQVRTAASALTLETLPQSEQPLNAGEKNFSITAKLNGATDEKLRLLAPVMKSQLKLHSIVEAGTSPRGTLRFVAHEEEPQDRLLGLAPGDEFFREHKAESLKLLPLAIDAESQPWSLPIHHTLIYGSTGSGKGSVIQGMIRQLEPFIHAGVAKIYGIDPKDTELAPYAASSLLAAYATGAEDMRSMVEHVFKLMEERLHNKKMDLVGGDLGRNLAYTTENPLIILFIDELLDLLIQDQKNRGSNLESNLTSILNKGRSLGIYVVAATQQADKELLGRMRSAFGNAILLRIETSYFNDLFLGMGAAAAGFDATTILVATPANGYASAGIAYVKDATGAPKKVRFAYSSDRAIADLILANLKPAEFTDEDFKSEKATDDFEQAPASAEDELNESWEFKEDEPALTQLPDIF